jgi:hypothetical protein
MRMVMYHRALTPNENVAIQVLIGHGVYTEADYEADADAVAARECDRFPDFVDEFAAEVPDMAFV